MGDAEGGSVSSGVGYGEGCAPAENGFWRILKDRERSFLYTYMAKSGGGQFALAFPYSKFWGDLSPRDLRPSFVASTDRQTAVSYTHLTLPTNREV